MKRLYRSKKHKVLGGVLGGLAEYFDIDPVLPRIIFLVSFVIIKPIAGLLVVFYIVSCIILPYKPNDLLENTEGSAKEIINSTVSNQNQKILAWSFIGIGVIALLVIATPATFIQYMNRYTWPILLILVGLLVLFLSVPKKK